MTTYLCFSVLTNWRLRTSDAIHSWWREKNSLIVLPSIECSYLLNGRILIWALFLWLAGEFLPLGDKRYSLPYKPIKEGGKFVHKSALIEKVFRTSTSIHSLIDLDVLSIFCHKAWSPECFLKTFCLPEFVRLLHTFAPFYKDSISTVEWVTQRC